VLWICVRLGVYIAYDSLQFICVCIVDMGLELFLEFYQLVSKRVHSFFNSRIQVLNV